MAHKEKYLRKNAGKIILRIVIILIAVVIGLIFFVAISAEKIINNNLSDYIFQKTDSIYRLDFKNIDISYKNKSVSFFQVVLKPDPKLIEHSPNKYYEFETSSLVISNIRIKQLYKLKRFSAASIKANNPKFKLSTGQDVDFEMFSDQKIEIGDSIKLPYLNEIFIDTILVTDARMKIDTLLNPGIKIPKVNLEILQFKLGGRKNTNTPFPFDVSDISLKIENLQERLSDRIHILTVNEVSLSLIHSKISAHEISLKPYSDSLVTPDNQYRVSVPNVEIISPYVQNFYTSDTISIEKLIFQSPEIEIKFGGKVGSGTPLNEINLYKLIENELRWISINEFSIKDAHLTFIPFKSAQVAQEFENLNVTFSNFRIDPNSYLDKQRILSSKELDITVGKFTLNHNDKVHQLVINEFNIDTKSRKASLGLITFKPVNTSNKLISSISSLVDIRCKGAGFTGVNFSEVYHHQILPMDELHIFSPEIILSLEENRIKNQKDNDISLVFEKTKDYVKGIYVKKTIIDKGKLNYNYISSEDKSGFFTTNFKFELTNLSIDSTTVYRSDKIFFANDFDVNFSDIRLQLADDFHRLMTDSIKLSSKGKAAVIYSLKILPIKTISPVDSLIAKGQQQIFDVSFPEIELDDADLHRAFFQKELLISDFNVFNPTINIDIFGQNKIEKAKETTYQGELYSLISDYLFSLKIGKLKMNNGRLNITQFRQNQSPVEFSNLFSVELTNFEIDSLSSSRHEKIFFSDNVDLILKNPSFTMVDGVHKVDAKELGILTSENRIYIKDARLYPDLASKNFNNLEITSFATIPSVEFNGADIRGFINNGKFLVNSVLISKPVIKLLFHKDLPPKSDTLTKPIMAIKGLDLFTADHISVKDGSIELANFSNMKSKTFATSTVDFSIDNFKIEKDKDVYNSGYADFAFTIRNTNITIPDNLSHMEIKLANYRLSDKLLKISNLSFSQGQEKNPPEPNLNFKFNIPALTMEGFDIKLFLEKKEVVASSLELSNPAFETGNNGANKDSTFNPFRINLYQDIKNIVEKIDIANIDITDASLKLNDTKQRRFDHLNFSGTSFLIDKNSHKTDKFLSFKHLRFETSNLKGKTTGGFYNYGIDKFIFSSNGEFSISGISLTPAYPEPEFNRRKMYQEDYITVTNANCKGNGFDIKRLLDNNEISFNHAIVDFDKVEIYRNNHFPAPPGIMMDMPQKELRNLKLKFIADSLSILCNRFSYRELEPHANTETKLFFTDINASIKHLTNIEDDLRKDPFSHLLLNAKLMGMGVVNAKLKLNIPSAENKFDLVAECGPMPLKLLNPITEPSLKLSIKEGRNEKTTLFIEANEDSAHGEINFSYKGLKISVLSEKDGLVREDKFISFLANTLAVKSDNPRPGKLIVPVSANSKREKDKSFITYCWKTILSGIKNTFGIKEEEP